MSRLGSQRTAQAVLAGAAIAFYVCLATQACKYYRGAATCKRFELAWVSAEDTNRKQAAPQDGIEHNIALLQRSLRLDGAHAYAHYALARQYVDLHDLVSGRRERNACAPAAPGSWLCRHFSLARAHLKQAIRLECTKAAYHEALGRWHLRAVRIRRQQGGPGERRAEAGMIRSGLLGVSLACDLDAGSSHQRLVLAQVYTDQGMIPAALGAYRRAWRQNVAFPRDWRDWRDRGYAILESVLALRRNVWDVEWVVGDSFADRMRIVQFLVARREKRFALPILMEAAKSVKEGELDQRVQVVDLLIRIRAGERALELLEAWLSSGRGGGAPEWRVIEEVSRLDLDKNLELFLAIARSYDVVGDRQLAAAVCERICRRTDIAKHPLVVLDLAQRLAAQGRQDEGIVWLERWQTMREAHTRPEAAHSREELKLLDGLASMYFRGKRYTDAARVFGLLMAEARDATDRARRAKQSSDCYFALGRQQEALGVCTAVVRQHPDCAHAHFVLGSRLQETGDTAGAVKALEAAVRLAPTNSLYAWTLAKVKRDRDLGRK